MKKLSDVTDNEIVDVIAGRGLYGCDVEDMTAAQLSEALGVPCDELGGLYERIERLIQEDDLWELPDGRIAPSAASWARILAERLDIYWLDSTPEGRVYRVEQILTGAL